MSQVKQPRVSSLLKVILLYFVWYTVIFIHLLAKAASESLHLLPLPQGQTERRLQTRRHLQIPARISLNILMADVETSPERQIWSYCTHVGPC